jgi:hypothetical protein
VRAFVPVHTEWDDNDLTYFVLYQLSVVGRAIDELHSYLARKMREVREVEHMLRSVPLNHRQLALLGHALRHPDATYTFASHANSNDVVPQSARTDLLDLEAKGLLIKRRIGPKCHFFPVADLAERIRADDLAQQDHELNLAISAADRITRAGAATDAELRLRHVGRASPGTA